MKKCIEITVDTKGNTKVETNGFAGSSCIEASRFIEKALGKQTGQRMTAEFYSTQNVQQETNING